MKSPFNFQKCKAALKPPHRNFINFTSVVNNYINFLRAKLSRGPRIPGSVENMGKYGFPGSVENTGPPRPGLWKSRGPGVWEIKGAVKSTGSRFLTQEKELCFDSPRGGMRRVRLHLSAL